MAKSDGTVGVTGAGVGDVKMTAINVAVLTGEQEPQSGWLLANGAAVSRTTYADLFAAVGTAYGVGDGTTTFNLPNLQQRFPLGQAQSGTGNTRGATGGLIDHLHTISHTHDITHTHDISHTHTMPHTHDMSNHTHAGGSHTHNVAGHTHLIESGDWSGLDFAKTEGTITSGGIIIQQGTAGTNASTVNQSHQHDVHIHGDTRANPTTTTTGNTAFNTGTPSTNTTGSASSSTTASQSVTTTGALSTTNSGVPSVTNSGTSNPPFVVLNYLIKY